MTQPRAWPNGARWSRDRAADLALEIVRALRPVVMDGRPMSETERFRREAQALSNGQEIVRLMESQGAPVREEF
jgi:hypothetical protein